MVPDGRASLPWLDSLRFDVGGVHLMSAFGRKADMPFCAANVRL
jgi:hypothetical protein